MPKHKPETALLVFGGIAGILYVPILYLSRFFDPAKVLIIFWIITSLNFGHIIFKTSGKNLLYFIVKMLLMTVSLMATSAVITWILTLFGFETRLANVGPIELIFANLIFIPLFSIVTYLTLAL